MSLAQFRAMIQRRRAADEKDGAFMLAMLRAPLTPYARRMLLSGLAGFDRMGA